MLNLASATSKLQLVTPAATAVHVQTSWVDLTTATGAVAPGAQNLIITSAGATTDIVPAPGAGVVRNVKQVTVHAVGGGQQVTLQHTDGSVVVELIDPTLQIDEHLVLTDGAGFQVLDVNGAVKQSGPGTTGRLLKQTTYVTGSATHTLQAGCTQVALELVGQGGGGGGAAFSSPNMGFGAGGASGGYLRKTIANPGASLTYTVGTAAGGGGANTGGTGTTGTDTTAVVNAVTYTAKGGLGGVGMAAASTLLVVAGGAGVIPTNGDFNMPGEPGNNGVRLSGVLGGSGAGGSGAYGSGGVGQAVQGVGVAGRGYGGGGGGGAAVSASVLGGAGAAGAVIITEYS